MNAKQRDNDNNSSRSEKNGDGTITELYRKSEEKNDVENFLENNKDVDEETPKEKKSAKKKREKAEKRAEKNHKLPKDRQIKRSNVVVSYVQLAVVLFTYQLF